MRIVSRRLVPIALFVGLLAVVGCGGGSSVLKIRALIFVVTTLAGSGAFGVDDGQSTAAKFHNPVNVAIDSAGNVYVADFDNGLIRKVTPTGAVTTLTSQPDFNTPFGMTFTPDGSLYVQTDGDDLGARDSTTGTIWKVNTTTGAATVVARDLGRPRGLTALSDGRLVLVDIVAGTVRLLNPTTAAITNLAGTAGVLGFQNGTGTLAKFDRPYGAAILPNGDILVADQNNNRLREITLAGVVTTYAGTGTAGSTNSSRLLSTFDHPQDVAIDSSGVIYVDDVGNHTIRRIATDGNVTTVAGSAAAGFADGTGTSAKFFGQEGIAVTSDGTKLYIADGTGGDDAQPFSRVRVITISSE